MAACACRTGRSAGSLGSCRSGRRFGFADGLELALLEALAQDLLVELADAGLGHLVDVGELVGDPPLRDTRPEMLLELGGRDLLPLLEHHAGEWALGPALVGLGD